MSQITICDVCKKPLVEGEDVVLLPRVGDYHQACYLASKDDSSARSSADSVDACPQCGINRNSPFPCEHPKDEVPTKWLVDALRSLARELVADPKTPWIGERKPELHICWTAADRIATEPQTAPTREEIAKAIGVALYGEDTFRSPDLNGWNLSAVLPAADATIALFARSQATAPSDIERAFQDACDEAGCAYDNEALLEAIHALKERCQAESDGEGK